GYGAPKVATEIVHDRRWAHGAEGIAGVQDGVLKVFEKPAVKTVGSALRYRRNVTDAAELRRVVDFADSNLCDRIERRKQFCQRRRRSRTDAADAVNARREHTGFGTNNRNIAACIGLHTRLRSQRRERTGRSWRAWCKRDR